MQRMEVATLISPTRKSQKAARDAALRAAEAAAAAAVAARPRKRSDDIKIVAQEEEEFLRVLEEKLQQRINTLSDSYVVLRAKQINYIAFRLHEALEPKRDSETQLIQAWTIQPQVHLKVKMNSHIQVLKLSTILREVQCLRLHQQSPLRSPIEVDIFPSVRAIEVINTEVAVLSHVYYFARQLLHLHIEQTAMDSLSQILCPEQGDKGSVVEWKSLEKLEVNCCELRSVDRAVNQLQAVQTLDLGWNKITSFETPISCSSLQVFNLCHNELQHVPPLAELRALRELDLSMNKLSSLRGLEVAQSLEVLDVSHNVIQSITELELLSKLPNLRSLALRENPISRRPDYRREAYFYLGEKVIVDSHVWTRAELQTVKRSRSTGTSASNLSFPPPLRQVHSTDRNGRSLVLTYPTLRPSTHSIRPHMVEIQNPPSIYSPGYRKRLGGTGSPTSSQTETSSTTDALEEDVGRPGTAGIQTAKTEAPPEILTVDDFFKSEDDPAEHDPEEEAQEMNEILRTITEYEQRHGSVSSTSSSEDETRRSRKYTASDFMRDFEEEETLIREGSITDIITTRSRSASQVKKHVDDAASRNLLHVRVLLCAEEASRYDLAFGIDGLAATLDVKCLELIETINTSAKGKPVRISRALTDVLAVGVSFHSSRAKIVTLRLRKNALELLDVTYQIDSASILERILNAVFAQLQQQGKSSQTVSCTCARCGGLSMVTREFMTYTSTMSSTDALVLYTCLMCLSQNVREVSIDKVVALCAAEAITITSKWSAKTPNTAEADQGRGDDESFYIEEHDLEVAHQLDMYDCVLVSSFGIREMMHAVHASDVDDHDGNRNIAWDA